MLGYQNWEQYTGHCWHTSAATEAVNNGASSLQMQKAFNWKSEKQPMRNVDHSERQAKDLATFITGVRIDGTESVSRTSTDQFDKFPMEIVMTTGYVQADGSIFEVPYNAKEFQHHPINRTEVRNDHTLL